MKIFILTILFSFIIPLLLPIITFGQTEPALANPDGSGVGELLLVLTLVALTFVAAIFLSLRTAAIRESIKKWNERKTEYDPQKIVRNWDREQVDKYLNYIKMKGTKNGDKGNIDTTLKVLFFTLMTSFINSNLFAQGKDAQRSVFSEGGIIITLLLIFIPLLAIIILMIVKVGRMSRKFKARRNFEEAEKMSAYLKNIPDEEITEALKQRKEALDYQIASGALSGDLPPDDSRGILKNINEHANLRFIEEKRKGLDRPNVEPAVSKLVIWFLVSATIWLIFGTTVGEYVGIKFVAPDA